MDHRGRRPMLRLLTVVDLCAVVIPCLLVWNGQLTSAESVRQHLRMVGVPGGKTLNEQDVKLQQLLADAVPSHVLNRKPQDSDFRPRDRVDEALMKSTGTFPADIAIVRQTPHGAAQGDVISQVLYQQHQQQQQQTAFSPSDDEMDDDVEGADDLSRSKKKVHFGFHAMRGRRSPWTKY